MTESSQLAEALAKFQAEMPVVAKSHTADTGKFKYTYAGLADVTAAAMPVLTKYGLSFSCCPRWGERGGYELAGVLLHASGGRMEGALPIGGNTPQEIGSALTYARRYLFGCMTGLVTDDDDDGAAASRRAPAKKAARPAAQEEDPFVVGLEAQVATPMTSASRGAMFAEFGKHNVPDDAQLAGINALLGTTYTSRGDLTEDHAKRVIADLKKRPAAVTV